ncbi:MAG: hypothetical protein GDA53_03840 [Rhodobacteraceae bacterium]|nr:hypothetical protein [Paracoccaceae bacterium]
MKTLINTVAALTVTTATAAYANQECDVHNTMWWRHTTLENVKTCMKEGVALDDFAKRLARVYGPEDIKNDALFLVKSNHTPKGNWRRQYETSPVDDSRTEYLSLSGTSIRGRYSISRVTPTFQIRCQENSTHMYFHFDGHFMSDHRHGHITYRIDKEKARTRKFEESNNNKSLGLWSGSGIGFLKSLFDHDKLFIRATPYNENVVETTFNITGLREAIKPLRKACNW